MWFLCVEQKQDVKDIKTLGTCEDHFQTINRYTDKEVFDKLTADENNH